jgi:hypothetical protein
MLRRRVLPASVAVATQTLEELMIRYRLQCDHAHQFETWFGNAATYDRQVRRGQVACPECGSTSVSKALMAPSVITSRAAAKKQRPAPVEALEPPPSGPQRLANAKQRELFQMMRKLREEVVAKSEYVGPRFAEEARKIHNEETEQRGIYGEATPREVKELAEDGVEVYPLPVLPDDHN